MSYRRCGSAMEGPRHVRSRCRTTRPEATLVHAKRAFVGQSVYWLGDVATDRRTDAMCWCDCRSRGFVRQESACVRSF
jgi:hypothetical protein